MPRRRQLSGTLFNFLERFGSRYSSFEGYWLFGMLVADLRETDIDLLGDDADAPGPWATASLRARYVFREQLVKAGFDVWWVRAARLTMTRGAEHPKVLVNGHFIPGYEIALAATVRTDLGSTYARSLTILAAPHQPQLEQRGR